MFLECRIFELLLQSKNKQNGLEIVEKDRKTFKNIQLYSQGCKATTGMLFEFTKSLLQTFYVFIPLHDYAQ